MMFQISEEAKQELARFASEELMEGEFIRVARQYQCGGSKFEIVVDEDTNSMDETLQFGGFHVVVNKSCLELLNACSLDYHQQGFVFTDDLGNQC